MSIENNPIIINASAIQAAQHCAAAKDIRYYLNGVYVNFKRGDQATVAGTDGYILFAGLASLQGQTPSSDPHAWVGHSFIIPIEVVKKLDKKTAIYELRAIGDGQYCLNGVIFKPLDGKYPVISRFIPSHDDMQKPQETSNYNPDLLVRATKALRAYYNAKPTTCYDIHQRGDSSGVMHAGENCAQVVIMPINNKIGSIQSFNRDYL
jgi:hypothetical protein